MNMIATVGAEHLPVRRHLHPEYLHAKDEAEAAKRQAIEDWVEDWADDSLADESIDAPLQALIEQDSGILQQLVADYRQGDAAELESTAGRLARALIEHIKSSAE